MEKAGAQILAGENYSLVEDGDHFTLCNPPSKEHASYALLVNFLKTCQHHVIYHVILLKSHLFTSHNFELCKSLSIIYPSLHEHGFVEFQGWGSFLYVMYCLLFV